MIRVEVDQESLRYVQNRLGLMRSKAPQVISSALNDTARSARMKLSSGVKSRYIVKSGESKGNMTIKRATYSRLQATITAQGSPIQIEKFKVTVPRTGAKFQVLKSSGLKAIVNKYGNKAFAAGMTRGHPGKVHNGIYQRVEEKGRFPIKSFYGPSSAKMVEKVYRGESGAGQAMKPEIDKLLQKNIERQIKRLVG